MPVKQVKSCELCSIAIEAEDHGEITCPGCGKYRVTDKWRKAQKDTFLDPQKKRRLCGVVRRDTDEHDRCNEIIDLSNYENIIARHDEPRSPMDQMHRCVQILGQRAPFFGGASDVGDFSAMTRRLYLPDKPTNAFAQLLGALERMDYATKTAKDRYALTLKGWELADHLARASVTGDQAFVAMWFHPGLDEALNVGFFKGLRDCGYNPYRVDRASHNNKIDDEIIANIRKSRLLVADLTGSRPNVFYEAGFAHGLGIHVLYTCNETYMGHYLQCAPDAAVAPDAKSLPWVKQVEENAFDVRQFLIMRWSTPEGLAKDLAQRINALGLALV